VIFRDDLVDGQAGVTAKEEGVFLRSCLKRDETALSNVNTCLAKRQVLSLD